MDVSRIIRAIKADKRNFFQLMVLTNQYCCPLLKEIFLHGSNIKDYKTLTHYFRWVKDFSNSDFEKVFPLQILKNLSKRRSYEFYDSFDISTWYLVIQYGCDNFSSPEGDAWLSPGTLENHLKEIKDFWNYLACEDLSIGDVELFEKLSYLRKLISDTMELAKNKYPIDSKVLDIFIGNLQSEKYEDCDDTFILNTFKHVLRSRGLSDLDGHIQKLLNVDLVAVIPRRYIHINVDQIYTDLQIIETIREDTKAILALSDTLSYVHSKNMQGVLLEGIAGVGKTILIKNICCEWLLLRKTRKCKIRELDSYDFVIPINCQDVSCESLAQFLKLVMPSITEFFHQDEGIIEYLLDFQILFLLDGVDKIEAETEKVLEDLLSIRRIKNITFMCTTRPQKLDNKSVLSAYLTSMPHLWIAGISAKDCEVFVTKYHKILKDLRVSVRDTKEILSFLRTTEGLLQEHWNIPSNLMLASLLLAGHSDNIRMISSAIELMLDMHNMTTVNLKKRLALAKDSSSDELDIKINDFVSLITKEALFGVRDSAPLISQHGLQRLTDFCSISNLPLKELLEAFLVQTNCLYSADTATCITFQDRGFQEFYAALHLYDMVMVSKKSANENKQSTTSRFLSRFLRLFYWRDTESSFVNDAFSQVHTDMTTPPSENGYQNTLTWLISLFYHREGKVDEKDAREFVSMLKGAGVTRQEHWIKVLHNTKCDVTLAKLISRLPCFRKGTAVISDKDVSAYAALLEHTLPNAVEIVIEGKPSLIPHLDEVLMKIVKGRVIIKKISFEYMFRHPGIEPRYMNIIDLVMRSGRFKMREYRGQMPSMLPPLRDIMNLCVSFTGGRDLSYLCEYLERRKEALFLLAVNVGNASQYELRPIPYGKSCGLLTLIPDVGKGEEGRRAKDIAHVLHTDDSYRWCNFLYFPRCSLTNPLEIKSLLECLEGLKVVEGIFFPSKCRPLNDAEEKELQRTAQRIVIDRYPAITWGKKDTSLRGLYEDLDDWELP